MELHSIIDPRLDQGTLDHEMLYWDDASQHWTKTGSGLTWNDGTGKLSVTDTIQGGTLTDGTATITGGVGTFNEVAVDDLNLNGRIITNSSATTMSINSDAGIFLNFTPQVGPGTLLLSPTQGFLFTGDEGADSDGVDAGDAPPFNVALQKGGEVLTGSGIGGKGGGGTFTSGIGGIGRSVGSPGAGGDWTFICSRAGTGGQGVGQDGRFIVITEGIGSINFTGPLNVSGAFDVDGFTDLDGANIDGTLNVSGIVTLTSGDVTNDAVVITGISAGAGTRGGVIAWQKNNDTTAGFLYANSDDRLVWDTAKASSRTDTGNAWIEFPTGNAEFNEGTFRSSVSVNGFYPALSTKTDTDYTLTANDDTILFSTSATTRTATLPAAATVTNKVYNIKKIDNGAGAVIIDGDGSETIDGGLTAVITARYENVTIISDGSNWHIL